MAKTFGVVAVLTVLSKFVGLARDVVVAAAYGTGVIADAYNYAYLFTGNILILFGGLGGPFHSSTVAVVSPQKDNRDSGRLVAQIMAMTVIALLVLTLIVCALSWPIAHLMAQVYNPEVPSLTHSSSGQAALQAMNSLLLPEKKVLYERQFHDQLIWMLPLIVISGIVGVSYGILNVFNKIFWPSLSPAIASIAIIVAVRISNPNDYLIYGIPLAIGTLAGAIGQMIAQFPAMFKLPLNWRLPMTPEPGLHEYTGMLWPAVISTSIGQLTVYVDMAFTFMTNQQGAWTAIVMSNRVVQLPLGILLTAMLVPILPRFTEQVTANNPDALKAEMRRALKFLWFASLPITAIFLALSEPIVQVLFERGNFDTQSSALVALAFRWLIPSIVFYVGRDLVTRVFYAYKDSSTPYKVAMIAIVVKASLDYTLLLALNGSVKAISIASSIMTVFNLTILTLALREKIGNLGLTQMIKPMLVMIMGSVLCGGAAYLLYSAVMPSIHVANIFVGIGPFGLSAGLLAKLAVLASASGCGIVLYLLPCLLFKLEEPLMFARRIPVLKRYVRDAGIADQQK